MTKRVVIVGAGQAGLSCAAKLIDLDPTVRVTLLGAEAHPPYQRPPLSKKYLTGEADRASVLLRAEDWYARNGIELRTACPVAAIDRAAGAVRLADGTTLDYDALVLATGSRPRPWPADRGGDLPGVYLLRAIPDADALSSRLAEGTRVLVLGGGYVGLEAAAVFASAGMVVRLVERADRILERVASPETSDHFRALHRSHGVRIDEGMAVDRLEPDGDGLSAVFADSARARVDLVLVGIGALPNEALARDAGLACDDGVLVDARGRTSDPAVFACGDVARFDHRGLPTRLESVQNAVDQGAAVAAEIAGRGADYAPTPWFWSDQYDTRLQIAGLARGYDRTVVRPGKTERGRSIWYYAGDALLAVDAIDDPSAYMAGKRLLSAGISPPPETVADPATVLKTLGRP